METDPKKQEEKTNLAEDTNKQEKKPEGSGVFDVDGNELPKIEGGYTYVNGGGSLGDNELA